MQAYTQAKTKLERLIISRLPMEIRHLYPLGTVMIVEQPLYGVPEAGTHWFKTYFDHLREKLNMETSSFDPCLLITTTEEAFGIVAIQTDDTLFLADDAFAAKEEQELNNA